MFDFVVMLDIRSNAYLALFSIIAKLTWEKESFFGEFRVVVILHIFGSHISIDMDIIQRVRNMKNELNADWFLMNKIIINVIKIIEAP